MRLFICDDSKLLLDRLCGILSEIEGVRIIGYAEDTNEAIKAIKRLIPDVVILDIRLPDGNGISVIEEIKKIDPTPRIIMFTNFPYLQYRKRCMDVGADFFFYKAVEFDKLINLINKLVKDTK